MHKRHNIGTSLVENCIIIGLVALISIGILTTFGGTIHEVLAGCHFKFKEFQPFGKSANAVTNEEQGTTDPIVVDPVDPGIDPLGGNVTPNDQGVEPDTNQPVGVLPTEVGVTPTIDSPIINGEPVLPITPGVTPSSNAFPSSNE